eukprot:gene8836-9782_t
MAAVRACSKLISRLTVRHVTRQYNNLLPQLTKYRSFTSIINHVPRCASVHVKEIQPKRFYAAEGGMTVQELQDQSLNVLKLFDKVDPSKVTLEAHFVKDLGLDSLDVVEVVMAFEDEFGVEISDDEAEKIFSVNDAVDLLKVKMELD